MPFFISGYLNIVPEVGGIREDPAGSIRPERPLRELLFMGGRFMGKAVLFDDVYCAGGMLETLGTMMLAMDSDVATLEQEDIRNIGNLLEYCGQRLQELSKEISDELEGWRGA